MDTIDRLEFVTIFTFEISETTAESNIFLIDTYSLCCNRLGFSLVDECDILLGCLTFNIGNILLILFTAVVSKRSTLVPVAMAPSNP